MQKKVEKPSIVAPLLMNVFLFPGLGQWLLKRKISGFIFILIASMLTIFLTIEIYHNIQSVLQALEIKTEKMDFIQTFVEVQVKVHDQLDLSKTGYLFLSLLICWFTAIVDVLRIGVKGKDN